MEARKLFEEANRRYWDELESIPIPRWLPFSYDMVNEVEKGNWRMLISEMVSGELREATLGKLATQCIRKNHVSV